MIVIGLTGSIGMGKSTVAAMFAETGVPVFDADAEVRRLQAPGGKALAAIEAAFPGTTGPEGLDRAALGAKVFGKPEALARLEAIMHPLVGDAERAFRRRYARAPIVVLDIPLLFERGGWRRVDAVAVVSAPAHVQRARVESRPGMSRAKFTAILESQLPDREKRRRADFVISTAGGKRATRRAVRALVSCLRRHGVRYCRTCAKSSSTRRRRA
jgi:dephospho-CoA kinase